MRSFVQVVFGVLLILGLFSCEGRSVDFSEPQPAGAKEVSKFKYAFRGTYMSLEDSSILEVSKSSVTQYWNVDVDVQINQDSVSVNSNDVKNIHVDLDHGNLNLTPSDDSTGVHVDYTKDVFVSGNSDVLKYSNKVYFMNYEVSDLSWELKTMFFEENGKLVIKDFHLSESDIENLKAYTEVLEIGDDQGEITGYYIQPTPKELDALMASDIFIETDEFIRIRK